MLVAGQRLGGDHRHHVIGRGVFLEVHHHLHIAQLRRAEWRPARDPGQLGGAQAEQPFAVAQQQVAYTAPGVIGTGAGQAVENLLLARALRETCPQAVEQIAEDGLAVGIAHRLEGPLPRCEVIDLPVVGEGPVLAPQLPGQGQGIGQGDPSDIGLADVADDVFGFDGIALDQLGNGRAVTGRRIMEAAHPTPLVEGHSPTVAMRTGTPTALHQPGKAETDIRGYIGAHAHQFTHSVTPPTKPRDFYWLDWSTFKGMVLQNLIRDRQEPALDTLFSSAATAARVPFDRYQKGNCYTPLSTPRWWPHWHSVAAPARRAQQAPCNSRFARNLPPSKSIGSNGDGIFISTRSWASRKPAQRRWWPSICARSAWR